MDSIIFSCPWYLISTKIIKYPVCPAAVNRLIAPLLSPCRMPVSPDAHDRNSFSTSLTIRSCSLGSICRKNSAPLSFSRSRSLAAAVS